MKLIMTSKDIKIEVSKLMSAYTPPLRVSVYGHYINDVRASH